MNKIFVSISAGAVLLLSAGDGWANHRTGGADGLLSGGDRQRQEQALQNALEFNRTGRGAHWTNPRTGHSGTVTPTRTYRNGAGRDCRSYRRSLSMGGGTAVANGTRCRTGNGVWRSDQARGPRYGRRYPYSYPYPYSYYHPYYPYTAYTPYITYPLSFYLSYHFGHFAGHRRYRYRRHHRLRRFRHRRR
jgi:surface antigen